MSKLSNMIEVVQSGRVKVFPQPSIGITSIEENTVQSHPLSKREYHLGITLKVKGYAETDNGGEMTELKKMCKRQILHEVFGEFQPLLRWMERAIYERNFDEARTALRELENEMRW